ncbi:hypothetical protein [Pseudomonas mandelii]|uniref:hypothetical protein n=1 Tax=Pseudomonas mandelii TaxID=75612 RepID=UPI001198286E|nr:hypothetical protein [Pseudomonas mandelii]TWS02812.1 hypothetical protein FJD35_31745 [Pseudomonas mandelii]
MNSEDKVDHVDSIDVKSRPANRVDTVEKNERPSKRSWVSSVLMSPFSAVIGKGDEAKDSVVWYVITRVVRLASGVLFFLFGVDLYYHQGENCMNILKEAWNVFVPIITLAMGYLFGKQNKASSTE